MFRKKSTDLQTEVDEKGQIIQNVVKRYNDAVAELRRRDAIMNQSKQEITDARHKVMEYELRINTMNGELVRRDISLSQRDNEIIALRQYVSELESRLGYNVGYPGKGSGVEIAYRKDEEAQEADASV